jgi:CBS domain containing-hemolysin-like protein
VEEPPFQQVTDDEWVVDGGARIEEVNEEMGVDLSTDNDLDTLGGFVFSELGDLPKVGDTVTADHVLLEVADVEGLRIKKIRVTRLPFTEGGDGGNGAG